MNIEYENIDFQPYERLRDCFYERLKHPHVLSFLSSFQSVNGNQSLQPISQLYEDIGNININLQEFLNFHLFTKEKNDKEDWITSCSQCHRICGLWNDEIPNPFTPPLEFICHHCKNLNSCEFIHCKQCNDIIYYTLKMQNKFKLKGYEKPKKCINCKAKKS